MKAATSDVAFTSSVKAAQQQRGSRKGYLNMEKGGGWRGSITPDLEQFIASADSFYLATASSDGQPYVQHRGGPEGFLKVLDSHTLVFADFKGNAQYISVGNLDENHKAYIFIMDYPNRRRVKIWGTAEYVEDDGALIDRVGDAAYRAQPERAIVFHVKAWDSNCPQHIAPRFSEADLARRVEEYENRIAELEAEVELLRASPRPSTLEP